MFSQPKFRRLLFQFLLVAAIALFIAWIWHNTAVNLGKRGQDISFAFLHNPANFPIDQALIPFQQSDSYWRVFWVGLLNTLLVSLLAVLSATLVGTLVGILRLSPNWLIQKMMAVFVEVFRNIPLLLQLFFWYFAVLSVLPAPRASTWIFGCDQAKSCLAVLNNRGLSLAAPHADSLLTTTLLLAAGAIALSCFLHYVNHQRQKKSGQIWNLWWLYALLIVVLPIAFYLLRMTADNYHLPALKGFNYQGGITILPELAALWIALTLYSAAYIAEYVRAGIQSVPRGQYEAAASLGLSGAQVMRLVILPQALRVIVPPLTNQYLNIVKNSSLAAAIAYPDLVSVFTGTALNQTGRAIEIIAMTMLVYLVISLCISLLMNLYHHRIRLVEK